MRIAEHLPLLSRVDPPSSHRFRVALDGTSSPHTAMSTSSQGAVLDRMDTTSHPSPGSQGDEPPPPPGPRDEAGAADEAYIEAILRLFVELETAVDAWQALYAGRAAPPHGPARTRRATRGQGKAKPKAFTIPLAD